MRARLFAFSLLLAATPAGLAFAGDSTGDTRTDAPAESVGTVKGTVKGKPFTPDRVEFSGTTLTLRVGKDFFADMKVTIFLFDVETGHVPAERTYRITPKSDRSQQRPHIHVSTRPNPKAMPKTDFAMSDYTLTLTFGKETTRGKLPGTITMDLGAKLNTKLSGDFIATVKGYRLNPDGTPDLTTNSVKTIEEAAKIYLAKTYEGVKLDEVKLEDAQCLLPTKGKNYTLTGKVKATFPHGGKTHRKIIRFVKDKTWAGVDELEIWQLEEAHPLPNVTLPRSGGVGLKKAVARHIEAELAKDPKAIEEGLGRTNFGYSRRKKTDVKTCTIYYRIGKEGERKKREFVLKKIGEDEWEIQQELANDERWDYKKGAAVKRKKRKRKK